MVDEQRKFEAFLGQLLHSTENGKVDWEDTADEGAFMASLRHGVVHVERRFIFDQDEERSFPVYKAYLYDLKGRLAEELTASEMSDDSLLQRLFAEARRSARETDNLLDQVSADLQTRGGQ
jgi:hypothetical protein